MVQVLLKMEQTFWSVCQICHTFFINVFFFFLMEIIGFSILYAVVKQEWIGKARLDSIYLFFFWMKSKNIKMSFG